ncbi:MAG: CCA-adding enzyme [Promethearchaeota archaeon]|nr:MAG: CCA-adding enzyme [Candidatus Lokiarchaeota archaeon]
MNKYNQIFNEVLEEISPTEKEIILIEEIVNLVKDLLNKESDKLDVLIKDIEPQGSTGIKQTQLRNDYDIDIFIGIDWNHYKEKLKGFSKKKTKKRIKVDFKRLCQKWIIPSLQVENFQDPRLLYAEHPYVQVDYTRNDIIIQIDIVLYFDLELDYIRENGPITAVDRSPWHGRFINNNLTNEQKDDVRILKQFFKAQHSYGDKSPIGKIGFIGYSAELLIYHFHNLLGVFQNFESLPNKPVDFFKRRTQELRKIPHFKDDHLLIIDPVDKYRNVASAIDKRAYKYCKKRIQEFLKDPQNSFFHIRKIPQFDETVEDKLLEKIYILELTKVKEDVHYTEIRDKLYSLGNDIKAHAEKEISKIERFGVILFELYFNEKEGEYNLVFYCENPNISKTYLRRGPRVDNKKHAEKFKKKNPNYIIKKQRLWVEEERDFQKFSKFLEHFLKDKIPESLNLINFSKALESKTFSGKQAVYLLKEMILPLYLNNT